MALTLYRRKNGKVERKLRSSVLLPFSFQQEPCFRLVSEHCMTRTLVWTIAPKTNLKITVNSSFTLT